MQRRVDTRGDVAEAFSETGRIARQAKLQVRRMDLSRGRRVVRDPCVGRHGQVPDDTDDFVPPVRFRAVQPLAVHRTDVPETASERVAAGGDGLREVAVDDDRIGLRRDVALGESAADTGRHLIDLEKGGIDLVEPGGEARQPPVERLGRHLAALDVDEDPGFLAGRAQGGRYVENGRVAQKPSRQLALAVAKERGALSLRALRPAGHMP